MSIGSNFANVARRWLRFAMGDGCPDEGYALKLTSVADPSVALSYAHDNEPADFDSAHNSLGKENPSLTVYTDQQMRVGSVWWTQQPGEAVGYKYTVRTIEPVVNMGHFWTQRSVLLRHQKSTPEPAP